MIGFSIKSIVPEGVHVEETYTSVVNGYGRVPNDTSVGTLEMIQALDRSVAETGRGIFTSEDGHTAWWEVHYFGESEAGKSRSFGIAKFWTASQKLAWMNDFICAIEGIADTNTIARAQRGWQSRCALGAPH